MSKYEGLDQKLRQAIFLRDNYRCRWCGRTNGNAYDIHHIRYRRGTSDDVMENLITLCRLHHNYVHDSYLIPKATAQEILWFLASDEGRGQSGIAVFRRMGINGREARKGRVLCGTPTKLVLRPSSETPDQSPTTA